MLIWALINTVLSVLALGFALLNKGAPHRLRFHVCFIALLCWLVPWAQVPGWLPNLLSLDLGRVEAGLVRQTATATQIPLIYIDTRSVPLANDFTVLHLPLIVFSVLFLIGLVLFAWNLLRHQLRLRSLKHEARNGSAYWQQCGIESEVPILLQNRISGAFSSGIFKPLIWVHDDLAASEELPTLLRHELTHIEQHDNWYLLAITLVEKLFWWNPLAWYLSKQTRDLQELSCDERCRATNADYAAELAALMLSNLGVPRSTVQEPLLLSANIFNKPNLDIQRLKVLQRTHQMKLRHIVSAVATAVLAVTAVGLVTAQPAPDQDQSGVVTEVKSRSFRLIKSAGDGQSDIVIGEPDMKFTVKIPPEGSASRMALSHLRADGEMDQFIRVEQVNGKPSITFKFSNAALPLALGPLANLVAGSGLGQFIEVAAIESDMPGRHIVMMRKDGQPDPVSGAVVLAKELNAEERVELEKIKTLLVEARARAEEAIRSGAKPAFDFAGSKKLVLEYPGAKTQQVTASGENLSLEEAIAKIADASGCNIFKDKDTIVVDYCKPQ